MQTLVFATVKFNAKDAQSRYDPEFTTVVTMDDGAEHRLYWKTGSIADHLRAGDVVAIEFGKGKWRLSRTQAPELLQKLETRKAQVAAEVPRIPPTTPTNGNGNGATVKQTASVEADCNEMIQIFSHLRRSLPQTPDECIQAMACTIWIQRNRR